MTEVHARKPSQLLRTRKQEDWKEEGESWCPFKGKALRPPSSYKLHWEVPAPSSIPISWTRSSVPRPGVGFQSKLIVSVLCLFVGQPGTQVVLRLLCVCVSISTWPYLFTIIVFWDRILLCRAGCPQTPRDPSAPASWYRDCFYVLGPCRYCRVQWCIAHTLHSAHHHW